MNKIFVTQYPKKQLITYNTLRNGFFAILLGVSCADFKKCGSNWYYVFSTVSGSVLSREILTKNGMTDKIFYRLCKHLQL